MKYQIKTLPRNPTYFSLFKKKFDYNRTQSSVAL